MHLLAWFASGVRGNQQHPGSNHPGGSPVPPQPPQHLHATLSFPSPIVATTCLLRHHRAPRGPSPASPACPLTFYHPAQGEKRGFAHVEFAEKAAAERALQLSGQQLLGKELVVNPAVASSKGAGAGANAPRVVAPGEPAPGCWFCLTNQKDVHLIASIQNECYLALDKGGLCPEHVLIVPVEHYPSTCALPASALAEARPPRACPRAFCSCGTHQSAPVAQLSACCHQLPPAVLSADKGVH